MEGIMKSLSLSLSALFLMGGLCFAEGRTPHLGLVNGDLKQCPGSPNCVSSQANDPEHAIAPLAYQDGRAEAYARLRRVLTEMKRTVIITEKEDYIHAEFRSFLFRFVDDVEFYFPSAQKLIHVRSASRVGYSDLGVNRKRVEEIRAIFSKP
jgi:uncharacterized protein (DUF1499 family)